MADNVTVRVEGLDKVLRKLARLGADTYKPAIAEAATYVKDIIARYPARRFGPQPFKTAKQKAYFFYALRAGLIEVPYRRGMSPTSQALGRRWTVEFRDGGRTGVVGNNATYARYVHGADDQSMYHQQTGWPTDRQVVQDTGPRVKEILVEHYRRAIARSE